MYKPQKFPKDFDLDTENAFGEREPVEENRLWGCLMLFKTELISMGNFIVLNSSTDEQRDVFLFFSQE